MRILKSFFSIIFSLFIGTTPNEHHAEMRRKINDPTYRRDL